MNFKKTKSKITKKNKKKKIIIKIESICFSSNPFQKKKNSQIVFPKLISNISMTINNKSIEIKIIDFF